MEYPFIGLHVLASISQIQDLLLLNDPERIQKILERGVVRANATSISWHLGRFEPQGCTVLGLLGESHVSVHTYPEHSSLFLDAFTCGLTCRPELILTEMLEQIGPCHCITDTVLRDRTSNRIQATTKDAPANMSTGEMPNFSPPTP